MRSVGIALYPSTRPGRAGWLNANADSRCAATPAFHARREMASSCSSDAMRASAVQHRQRTAVDAGAHVETDLGAVEHEPQADGHDEGHTTRIAYVNCLDRFWRDRCGGTGYAAVRG